MSTPYLFGLLSISAHATLHGRERYDERLEIKEERMAARRTTFGVLIDYTSAGAYRLKARGRHKGTSDGEGQ